MAKEITITLRLTVEDLPDDEMAAAAEAYGMGIEEIAASGDVFPSDLADWIASMCADPEPQQEYIWAGSALHARITACEVVSAA